MTIDTAQLGVNLNLATTIRWIAMIPWQFLNPIWKTKRNVAFNVVSCTVPEIALGSTTVSQFGYPIEFPTYTIQSNKIITVEYMLSSDFHQYQMLWYWANKTVISDGSGAPATFQSNNEFMLPVRIIALSEFKRPIFEIRYKDCWVKEVGPLVLNYQDNVAPNIKHSFTLAYSMFDFPTP